MVLNESLWPGLETGREAVFVVNPVNDFPAVDLAIVGATAPGIVAAIRAAREGLKVALFAEGNHLGGSLPSLGAFETHYRGNRAPLLQELIEAVKTHYRRETGKDSEAYRICAHGKMVTFEPKAMHAILERWVAAEPNILLHRGWRPVRVERAERKILAVHFEEAAGGATRRCTARTFVEAGYEGDLMALAGVAFRFGRESRNEFGEPRGGRVFTRWLTGIYPRDAAEGRLNLVTAGATTSAPLPGSTGEGDGNVQSYSFRFCLTDDPANRRLLACPPDGYARERYAPLLLPPAEKERLRLPFHHRFLISSLEEMAERDHVFHGHALPNRKRSWNATNLTGGGKDYAFADPAGRRRIAKAHRRHALGLMWFLQNDPDVPRSVRAQAGEWGLAADEFTESDNIPPQLYVREARRLRGRAVFTEHDALVRKGAQRAPVKADAIAITEFSLDSLACTTERMPGTLCDGQLFQMEVSRPGQIPWGALLPPELDNFVVITTVSATHVGWGTVRQTPTLMHLAESAAWAAVLAARKGIPVAEVNIECLQRALVEHGMMLTFFNDVDMSCRAPWLAAVQYLGTKGFFETYDARPQERTGEGGPTRAERCLQIYREGALGFLRKPASHDGASGLLPSSGCRDSGGGFLG